MITVSINPILLQLGTHIQVRWYGLIVILAIAAGLWLAARESERKGFSRETIYDLAVWLILGGMVGARLFHVIDHWPDVFSKDPGRIIAIWEGGLAIWGAITGGLITLFVIAWKRGWKLPTLASLLDAFAPGVVLGQGLGRLACIITGDSVGRPTSGPFGLAYTSPHAMVPELGVYYTPTPVYEILLNGAILFILWRLRKIKLPAGTLFLVYLSLYSVGRFFITFLSSYREFAFGLNQAQVVSLLGLAVSLPLMAYLFLQRKTVGA